MNRGARDRMKLPYVFDAEALARDADGLGEDAWIKHFNRAYYEGDWSGIPLRSPHGRLTIAPDPADTAPYLDTPLIARCPAVREVLRTLAYDTKSVRFLRLGPGASVREHSDFNIGLDYGFVRLHVGVRSGPGAEMVLNGVPLHVAPGECWFTDVTETHSVRNTEPTARIHLVVDAIVNDPLRALITAQAGLRNAAEAR